MESAPPWQRLLSREHAWQDLQAHVEEGPQHVRGVEQQIGLLSRYIMLQALWEDGGWSKKERFDAAVAAIKAVEGAKGELWVQQGPKVDYTLQEYNKERKEVEARLRSLLAREQQGHHIGKAAVVDAAARVVEIDVVREGGNGSEA